MNRWSRVVAKTHISPAKPFPAVTPPPKYIAAVSPISALINLNSPLFTTAGARWKPNSSPPKMEPDAPESSFSGTESLESADEIDEISSSSIAPPANSDLDGASGSGSRLDGFVETVLNHSNVLRNVVVLSCDSTAEGGSCVVYLVGTAHVSQESCIEVQDVIRHLKPQVVFLELCSSRVAVLGSHTFKVPTMSEMVNMLKKKQNAFGIMYGWFLAKVASQLEVIPGSEFRVAFEEAKKYGGKVILGDRPVHITFRRMWGKMPLWHKAKLLFSMVFQALVLPSAEDLNKMIKDMGDNDMLTLVIQEMSKEFPTLLETVVHERDLYMSSTLLRVAKEHSSVVAVVGKGHVQGIKKHWEKPIDLTSLVEMPSRKPALSSLKIITSLGVAAAGVAIISGIYLSSKK